MGTGRNICPYFRKVKCSPHSAYLEGGCTKLSDIELQAFVGNQLAYRNTGAVKTLCVRRPFIRIADCQDIDRLQVGGERKFLAKNIRLEVASGTVLNFGKTKQMLCLRQHRRRDD